MKLKIALAIQILLCLGIALHQPVASADTSDDDEETTQTPQTKAQVEALMLEGQTNYNHGRYRDALQAFEQAKTLGTTSSYQKATLALGLAESMRSMGRYKEAEELFKKAIEEAADEDKKHLNKKYKKNRKRASDLVPMMMSDLSVL